MASQLRKSVSKHRFVLPVNHCVHLNVNEDYQSHSSSPFALIKYSVTPPGVTTTLLLVQPPSL